MKKKCSVSLTCITVHLISLGHSRKANDRCRLSVVSLDYLYCPIELLTSSTDVYKTDMSGQTECVLAGGGLEIRHQGLMCLACVQKWGSSQAQSTPWLNYSNSSPTKPRHTKPASIYTTVIYLSQRSVVRGQESSLCFLSRPLTSLLNVAELLRRNKSRNLYWSWSMSPMSDCECPISVARLSSSRYLKASVLMYNVNFRDFRTF